VIYIYVLFSYFCFLTLKIYQNYAAVKGWSFTILNSQETDMGGLRVCLGKIAFLIYFVRFSSNCQEATISVKGTNVFSTLKFESGVHRVQRVPVTEASGRLHTSTMSVVVLPELEEVLAIDSIPCFLLVCLFVRSFVRLFVCLYKFV
jgi:protein subunit release factor A